MHRRRDEFVVGWHRRRDLVPLERERQEIVDVGLEHHSDGLHERAVERSAGEDVRRQERGDLARLALRHRQGADPRDVRLAAKPLQRRRKALLVTGERQPDQVNPSPVRAFRLQELRQTALAHAEHLGLSLQRAQRRGGRHGIFLPPPTCQYQRVHGVQFNIFSPRVNPPPGIVLYYSVFRGTDEGGRVPSVEFTTWTAGWGLPHEAVRLGATPDTRQSKWNRLPLVSNEWFAR